MTLIISTCVKMVDFRHFQNFNNQFAMKFSKFSKVSADITIIRIMSKVATLKERGSWGGGINKNTNKLFCKK